MKEILRDLATDIIKDKYNFYNKNPSKIIDGYVLLNSIVSQIPLGILFITKDKFIINGYSQLNILINTITGKTEYLYNPTNKRFSIDGTISTKVLFNNRNLFEYVKTLKEREDEELIDDLRYLHNLFINQQITIYKLSQELKDIEVIKFLEEFYTNQF